MSTTAQINAYLAWRSEREGKTVDVSPEAYERDRLISLILMEINAWQYGPQPRDVSEKEVLDDLGALCRELDELENN